MQPTRVNEESTTLPLASGTEAGKSSRLLPALVLFFSLCITYFLWQIERDATVQRLQEDFDFRVREGSDRIEQRLLAYEQVLRGAQGLFAASGSVEREEFRTYVTHHRIEENYPGIQGVGFSLIVTPAQKDRHTAAIRMETSHSGYPQYSIRPDGERSIYTSIIYLEPFSGRNLRAFGYDMYSEPVRRAAMEEARDSGKASITGKVTLVQETEKDVQAGFLMYLPIYRNNAPHNTIAERRANIVGWAYSPFRMDDLMHGIFGERAHELDYEIFDGDEVSDKTLLYDSDNSIGSMRGARFQTSRRIAIAGHTWTMLIGSYPAYEARLDTYRANLIAQGGIGVSLLLTLLTWVLVNGRQRALAYAHRMNLDLIRNEHALRDSEAKLQAILNAAQVGVAWASEDGRIEYINPKFISMFGYTLEDVPTIEQWNLHAYPDMDYRAKSVAEWNARVARSLPERTAMEPMELDIACKDGAVRHVILMGSWAGTRLLANFSDITERKAAERKLLESEARLRAILDNVPYLIWLKDTEGRFIAVNEAFFRTTGQPGMDQVIGKTEYDLWPKELADKFRAADAEVISTRQQKLTEEMSMENGRAVWVETFKAPILDKHGELIGTTGFARDITQLKDAEQELRKAMRYNRSLIEASLDPLVTISEDGKITDVNNATIEATGMAREQLIGSDFSDYFTDPEKAREGYRHVFLQGSVNDFPLSIRHRDGHTTDVLYSASVYRNEAGEVAGVVAAARDITKLKQTAARVEHLAHFDALTDLPNRTLFNDRLQQALAKAKRDKGRCALLFLDLDNFKPVNDTFGHAVGDLLLQEAAKRMRNCVRESDTVARIGGDEFVVLLPAVDSAEDALLVAEKIRHALHLSFIIAGHTLHVSSSIGIAVYPEHGSDEAELSDNADSAMYFAKEHGRNNVRIYHPAMLQTEGT